MTIRYAGSTYRWVVRQDNCDIAQFATKTEAVTYIRNCTGA